jgi:retron-type reverse transcriptase
LGAVRCILELQKELQAETYRVQCVRRVFIPKRNGRMRPSLRVRDLISQGLTNVIDIDIEGFFDHINHDRLLSFVMERVTDPYVIRLVREWLRAGVVYLDSMSYPEEGTPQGGVISPLLANAYLHKLTRLSTSHDGYRQPRSYGLMRLSGRISRS